MAESSIRGRVRSSRSSWILIKFETTMPELMETLSQKKKKKKTNNKKLFSGSKAQFSGSACTRLRLWLWFSPSPPTKVWQLTSNSKVRDKMTGNKLSKTLIQYSIFLKNKVNYSFYVPFLNFNHQKVDTSISIPKMLHCELSIHVYYIFCSYTILYPITIPVYSPKPSIFMCLIYLCL